MTDLQQNFKRALEITMSNPPLPEVVEHEYNPANQWQHQLDAIVSSPASFEKLWGSVNPAFSPSHSPAFIPASDKFELVQLTKGKRYG